MRPAAVVNGLAPLGAVVSLLHHVGENPDREGLRDTPARYLRAMREMTSGYGHRAEDVLGAVFNEPCDEMVVVSGLPFHSLCEHHLLPFHGTATIGYLPRGKVVGLSKLPRLLELHARRLQIQERLTRDIAHDIERVLNPLGVGVVLCAHHTCMSARGVRSAGNMITATLLGAFKTDPTVRAEFMAHGRA